MAEIKTKRTTASPTAFIKKVTDEQKRKDGLTLLRIFSEVTGQKPVMWGTAIIGYGQYHYESQRSSQKGDWLLIGFSPRKDNLTLYVHPVLLPKVLLKQLGPHKTSMGCLYIKRLSDIDMVVLKKLIKAGYQTMKKRYG